MKNLLSLNITIVIVLILFGCSSPPFTTDIIMFDKKIYSPTIANDIKV